MQERQSFSSAEWNIYRLYSAFLPENSPLAWKRSAFPRFVFKSPSAIPEVKLSTPIATAPSDHLDCSQSTFIFKQQIQWQLGQMQLVTISVLRYRKVVSCAPQSFSSERWMRPKDRDPGDHFSDHVCLLIPTYRSIKRMLFQEPLIYFLGVLCVCCWFLLKSGFLKDRTQYTICNNFYFVDTNWHCGYFDHQPRLGGCILERLICDSK